MENTDLNSSTHASIELRRTQLRWRARRGLLENDLIIERFFERYENQLSDADIDALTRLLALSDNDLMDLLLARTELRDELNDPDTLHVLALLRAL